MANQSQSRGMQTQKQEQTRRTEMQNRTDQPQTYYSYSYGYGYYDPFTGDWIEELYGPFTGVGPQNYQRSDDRIEEDVCDRLTQHGRLDASDVDVSVKSGEVLLKGTVPDRHMKRLAEDLAFGVPGVFDVQNQLRIVKQQWLPGAGQRFRSQLRPGMEVFGLQGKRIGTLKEIHDNDFLIDRPMAPDVHVPLGSIQKVENGQIHLTIPADQLDKMHWPTDEKTSVR